jgi:uncharacterized protein YndB with AHSA1/START domain
MANPASSFIYVTFIRTTPERLWSALTDPETMKQYWFGAHQQAEWRAGAEWKLVSPDGRTTDAGEVEDADRPKRLVLKWRNEVKPELKAEGYSRCVFEIEPVGEAVKLTVTHSIEREDSKLLGAVSGGWPKVLSNLKSLLETGAIVLHEAGCKS